MHQYQKENHIIKHCTDNVLFLYDCIRASDPSLCPKICAVLCIKLDIESKHVRINMGHLVVVIQDKIFDPSFELCGFEYYSTVKNFKTRIHEIENTCTFVEPVDKRLCVKTFLHFQTLATRMNQGEGLISDRDYYNKQADHVELLKF